MNRMIDALQRLWYDQEKVHPLNPLPFLLLCLSMPYRGAVNLRNILYDLGVLPRRKLPCPVISVGNITVGGTGKTPTVIMIAKMLQKRGYRPAILSRGYGGSARTPVNVVSDGTHILMGHVEAGEEPVLMAKAASGVPVLTGARRYLTGEHAVQKLGADVLVLDDAFQHRNLHRDINIVLFKALRPLGNGFPLPLGPLREPVGALRRADLIIWTGTSSVTGGPPAGISAIPKDIPLFRGFHEPKEVFLASTDTSYPPEYLRGKRLFAFAGIGFPLSFRMTLEDLGAQIAGFIPFPDHHCYTEQDIKRIREAADRSAADLVITTEKDAIKLADHQRFFQELFVLRIEMMMVPEPIPLERWIIDKLNHRHPG